MVHGATFRRAEGSGDAAVESTPRLEEAREGHLAFANRLGGGGGSGVMLRRNALVGGLVELGTAGHGEFPKRALSEHVVDRAAAGGVFDGRSVGEEARGWHAPWHGRGRRGFPLLAPSR